MKEKEMKKLISFAYSNHTYIYFIKKKKKIGYVVGIMDSKGQSAKLANHLNASWVLLHSFFV